MGLWEGRRRYVGYALIAVLALWSFGVFPHRPRLVISNGKPDWARARSPHTRATALETWLAGAASRIAGRNVSVRCERLDDLVDGAETGGVVEFSGSTPANYTRIQPYVCSRLHQLAADRGAGGSAEASAVDVLTHESFHLRGVKDEAATECYAIQFVSHVARSLGATAPNARRLQVLARHAYPLHPKQYLSSECRPGGSLDLHGKLPAPA